MWRRAQKKLFDLPSSGSVRWLCSTEHVIAFLLISIATPGCSFLIRHVGFQSSQKTSINIMAVEANIETIPEDVKLRPRDVRFISPLLDYGYPPAVEEYENRTLEEKPIFLYLPGFDGSFLSPFVQFPELHTLFDVRCMNVGIPDRSTFEELKQDVVDYLETESLISSTSTPPSYLPRSQPTSSLTAEPNKAETGSERGSLLFNLFGGRTSNKASESSAPSSQRRRPIYLAGESFGGILALEVVRELLQQQQGQPSPLSSSIQGVMLINPATCFDRSRLAVEGPQVANLHPLLFPLGLLRLVPLFTDEHSLKQLVLILQAKGLPSVINNAQREAFMGRVALSLPWVIPVMTQEALQWRLSEWLDRGCEHLTPQRLSQFRQHNDLRVIIVVGEKDAALPSIAEAERLSALLPTTFVHVVEGAGHASTCGSRVDLAALFRKCFKELRGGGGGGRRRNRKGRTVMSHVASSGSGEYFGMEPRYDNNSIGLNPLLYWNRDYYRRLENPSLNLERKLGL